MLIVRASLIVRVLQNNNKSIDIPFERFWKVCEVVEGFRWLWTVSESMEGVGRFRNVFEDSGSRLGKLDFQLQIAKLFELD